MTSAGKTASMVVTVIVAIAALGLKSAFKLDFFTAVGLGLVALMIMTPLVEAVAKRGSGKGAENPNTELLKSGANETSRSSVENPPSAETPGGIEAHPPPPEGIFQLVKLIAVVVVGFPVFFLTLSMLTAGMNMLPKTEKAIKTTYGLSLLSGLIFAVFTAKMMEKWWRKRAERNSPKPPPKPPPVQPGSFR